MIRTRIATEFGLREVDPKPERVSLKVAALMSLPNL